MRTSGNYGYRHRRFTKWFALWFVATLAVMVIGLVIEQAVNPGWPDSQSTHQGGKNGTTSPSEMPISVPTPPWGDTSSPKPQPKAATTSNPATTPAALTGPVQVVQGKQQVNGVELGFPHSTTGAVSAASADATEALSTLDPDRAAAVMRLIADPSWSNAPQQAAAGAAGDRKQLGLPASGSVPDGASLQTVPVEYQVRAVTPDRVLVLLLCDGSVTTPGNGTQTKIGVLPFQMRWDAGDWKVQSVTATQADLNLAVEPDSPQAQADGWQPLETAGD